MATIDLATPLPWHKAVAQLSLLFIGALLMLACSGALMLELAHG
ncbi:MULTISPECIES: hypothetical protein [unclassified Pseudomonas]|nr:MULTISPECIES: hypothetical protein [unclassified Pseudomonas]SCZ74042.1 hypothetical protein SAMN03159460_04487 [Pseudomonas sp. NFPP17]SDA81002.1 hypothetical protein SAMN03159464_04668 [Pseudomonas sp. NFPP15]SEL77525.1 hypothetical protein SAMN03159324_05168 [Pseudomonas sp. NFPP18]SFA66662.1 hypothetical protein SAMN03159320_04986 [Pseudomonas sp. NFPP13]SFU08039.1 hypothetical protein SAMN03159492_05445 [Pseudomonas sp. NFPP25]